MSIRLQHLREAASFLSSFIGKVGEIAIDLTNNRLIMHDGVTAGGWPAAKLSEVITNARTIVADANYAALATDRLIAFTALTAARTVTLPGASAYPTGTQLVTVDESGACSATNVITLARAGSDTINGATSAVVASAYGFLALESNGSNKWTIVDQATGNLPPVGIGTAADPSNPLSVFGTSALFNSAGNFNFTINKAASSNTASTIYQDGFSGRAQVGLCGDDNFHFKVSPDGSTWHDALDISGSSGLVTANFGIALAGTTSGATALQASATASGTLTLPAATGTLVTSAQVAMLRYFISGVNFNSANTDNAIAIALPPGVSRYNVNAIGINNASASLSSSTLGVFTATGGGGVAVALNQAVTVTQSATDSNGNLQFLTINNANTTAYNDGTLYVRIGTAQGSPATADVIVDLRLLS